MKKKEFTLLELIAAAFIVVAFIVILNDPQAVLDGILDAFN